ncbi:hypothetical protein COV15_01970 [Candidatus Woesearchaeota archaeon CG10_big_fil_rev_8_21_14_0_10_34_12]|nr:MAG: hypothetical protein COV15_01970 [Candidatus Woesearchaeota archaeon CG10_big_fil_rev_8_21_14_0_10_34_12]
MELVDINGKPIIPRIYTGTASPPSNPHILHFYQEDDVWKSKNPYGYVALLGSLNSGPNDVVANAFKRIPYHEIKKCITDMKNHREEVDKK